MNVIFVYKKINNEMVCIYIIDKYNQIKIWHFFCNFTTDYKNIINL